MRRPLRLLLVAGLLAAPVLVLGPALPLREWEALLLHLLVGLGAATIVALAIGGPRGPRVGFFVVAAIAVAAEAAQTLTPRRSSDPLDAVAGIVGAAVGAVLVLLGRHLRAWLAERSGSSTLPSHQPRREP